MHALGTQSEIVFVTLGTRSDYNDLNPYRWNRFNAGFQPNSNLSTVYCLKIRIFFGPKSLEAFHFFKMLKDPRMNIDIALRNPKPLMSFLGLFQFLWANAQIRYHCCFDANPTVQHLKLSSLRSYSVSFMIVADVTPDVNLYWIRIPFSFCFYLNLIQVNIIFIINHVRVNVHLDSRCKWFLIFHEFRTLLINKISNATKNTMLWLCFYLLSVVSINIVDIPK